MTGKGSKKEQLLEPKITKNAEVGKAEQGEESPRRKALERDAGDHRGSFLVAQLSEDREHW